MLILIECLSRLHGSFPKRWMWRGCLLGALASSGCVDSGKELDFSFDPGCEPSFELSVSGAALGQGGSGSETFDPQATQLSSKWGYRESWWEEHFFEEFGLDADNTQDRRDFDAVFGPEELRFSFYSKDEQGEETQGQYSLSIYIPRGTLPSSRDPSVIAIQDAAAIGEARRMGDRTAAGMAFRELAAAVREGTTAVAIMAYCPPSDELLLCMLRSDAVYASSGQVELSKLIQEDGIFVSDDNDDFFAPQYWLDAKIQATFMADQGVEATVTCEEL